MICRNYFFAIIFDINYMQVNDRYKVMGTSSGAETSRQGDVRTTAVDTQEHPASVAIKVALA
ncbi:hypothetical protein Hanom_Chr03g00232861 [Helianthus anomalus]